MGDHTGASEGDELCTEAYELEMHVYNPWGIQGTVEMRRQSLLGSARDLGITGGWEVAEALVMG